MKDYPVIHKFFHLFLSSNMHKWRERQYGHVDYFSSGKLN